ncbi:MAG TPA: oligosaccharide flippase family protein [Rhizomicrobium sp.]|jgi:O-antigen/teichoic acid export membrane protein|nr:oligosaccharide flippase family protein [Rhizomicrobium sp.]
MPDSSPRPEKSLGWHLLHGSFWMIAARWAIRFSGAVSTVILARLLTPSDFGIVAMAMILVGMLEVINQTGQKLVIIRHPNPARADYDTCWTISILLGLTIAALIIAIAPLSERYFHDARVLPVMQCLALRSALGGFENVGVLDFRRDLTFDRLFRYTLYPKLITFFITIFLALALRSYWALVSGMISTVVVTNVLSYTMHRYRPSFSLEKLPEVWSFSFWTLVRAIGWYLNFQVDLFAIGGVAGAAAMGRYSVASDVAAAPSRELNDPLVATLYPVMSKVQHDYPRLKELYLQVLCWSAIICASTSVGIALVARDTITIFLGPKWLSLAPLVPWLALSTGMLGLASGAYSVFDSIGVPQIGARMQWLRVTILAVAIAPVVLLTRNLEWLAAIRLAATLLFMPTLFFAVGRAIGVSPWEYFRVFWRPFSATAVMTAVVLMINLIGLGSPIARLPIDAAAGAIAFVVSVYLLWHLSGRPESAESDVLVYLDIDVPSGIRRIKNTFLGVGATEAKKSGPAEPRATRGRAR